MTGDVPASLGLDFGTTNTVVALANGQGAPQLVPFDGEGAGSAVFRSALCFWEDEGAWKGVASEAGPWAIHEYLQSPLDSRFVQSFKTVAASPLFERAQIFGRAFRFEEFGRTFLNHLRDHAGDRLDRLPPRIVVGRPVEYAGWRPDPALARQRYDAMLDQWGTQIHYVYEPLGAAFGFASRLDRPTTLLVADFGGGTTDFSVVRVAEPGRAKRCEPLAAAGIGIAGDHFDKRIVDNLVLPLLGKDGLYRSFGKVLEIPGGYFGEFSDWSRLALMRNRRTLEELRRLQRDAVDPAPIGRMIALIEHEQGFPLYEAVGRAKRNLSMADETRFTFDGGGVRIDVPLTRGQFDQWIAGDLDRIDAAMMSALTKAAVTPEQIDRVFLTGGTSLIPAIRARFEARFGVERIASGDELTSIANGLAMIGQEANPAEWSAD